MSGAAGKFVVVPVLLLFVALLPTLLYIMEREVLYQGHGVEVPESLAGKLVLVTGGSQGIGQNGAIQFMKKGAKVIMTGRSKSKTTAAAKEAAAGLDPTLAIPMTLDLSRFDSVREFCKEVTEKLPKIDILILNAGISYQGGLPSNTTAPSGHDLAYATNYMGHYLLFRLLQPRLAPNAPIVMVGSASMWTGNFFDLMPRLRPRYDIPIKKGGRPINKAYATSKLAEVCMVKKLRRMIGDKHLIAPMAPGFVDTGINGKVGKEESPCRKARLEWWCGSPEVSGQMLVETAYITKRPQPDFVYPYAYPKTYYSQFASPKMEKWRHGNGVVFGLPSQYQKLTFGLLHESVGPDCDVKMQDALWAWTEQEVGLGPAKAPEPEYYYYYYSG